MATDTHCPGASPDYPRGLRLTRAGGDRQALESTALAEAEALISAEQKHLFHPDDDAKFDEHLAMVVLTNLRQRNHTAIKSGVWSDPEV